MRAKVFLCIVLGVLLFATPLNAPADERADQITLSGRLVRLQKALDRVAKDLPKSDLCYVRKANVKESLRAAAEALQDAQSYLTMGNE